MQSLLSGIMPRWLTPLLFATALVTGREQAAIVANGDGWTQLVAITAALAVYLAYVPALIWLSRRWSRLDRAITAASKSKVGDKLFGSLDSGPAWWQFAKVVASGFVPTVGLWIGIFWARRQDQDGMQAGWLRIAAVAVGGAASYACYNAVIGWIFSLPLVVGLSVAVGCLALIKGWHYRRQLARLRGLRPARLIFGRTA